MFQSLKPSNNSSERGFQNIYFEPKNIEIRLDGSSDRRAEVSSAITASGTTIIGMETRKASLEETFMTFTDDNVIGLSKAGEVE